MANTEGAMAAKVTINRPRNAARALSARALRHLWSPILTPSIPLSLGPVSLSSVPSAVLSLSLTAATACGLWDCRTVWRKCGRDGTGRLHNGCNVSCLAAANNNGNNNHSRMGFARSRALEMQCRQRWKTGSEIMPQRAHAGTDGAEQQTNKKWGEMVHGFRPPEVVCVCVLWWVGRKIFRRNYFHADMCQTRKMQKEPTVNVAVRCRLKFHHQAFLFSIWRICVALEATI